MIYFVEYHIKSLQLNEIKKFSDLIGFSVKKKFKLKNIGAEKNNIRLKIEKF